MSLRRFKRSTLLDKIEAKEAERVKGEVAKQKLKKVVKVKNKK